MGGEEPSGHYSSFDQEYQHVLFWGFVRDGKWDTVEAFLDKKVGNNFQIMVFFSCICRIWWSLRDR